MRTQSVETTLVALIGVMLAVPVDRAAMAGGPERGTRLLRDPDVSHEAIVFAHANDLWVAGRAGGDAFRLTSDIGAESDPSFSPDGGWIAFTGQYDGNTDVYVLPATGGRPKRLTWHPGPDVVQGWTPDGEVLFQSGRAGQPTKEWQLYTVDANGGFPRPLPLPRVFRGEMSADGEHIAYQEIRLWDQEWRNYRGGQAQPIAVVSTRTWERTTPTWKGERQLEPVWLDGIVYYLSERDWAANVWAYDPATGEDRQVTFHEQFDVKSLGAGAGVLVYEQGGYLHELDPRTNDARQLVVNVSRDLNQSRPRWEDLPPRSLRNARLSPTGKRALFEARGDVFTVPVDEGSWRNISRTSGIADRHPVWSPDGDRIAWFNDADGEYALVIADQYGNEQRRIAIPGPTFFFTPAWSPDGAKLAFTDTDYRVLVLDLETGSLTHVDTDGYAHPERSMNPVWSPDSRWIAYARRLPTQLRVIVAHDTETGETHELTDGMADSISPVWDASGTYLYFLASTDFALNIGWLDMTSYDRPVTRQLYLAILPKDEPSPFLPKSDDEAAEEEADTAEDSPDEAGDEIETQEDEGTERDEDAEDDGDDGDGGDEAEDDDAGEDDDAVAVRLDLDGLARRIVAVPGLGGGDHLGLVPGPDGTVFVLERREGQPSALHRYVVEDAEATEFLVGATSITVAHDRATMLYSTGGAWSVTATGGAKAAGEAIELDDMRVKVDPRAEWRQMLREGWRFMRDFLYVDNMHGAPWNDVWEWYSPWLADCNHRADFNYLLDIVSGEIAVGHSFVAGGDYPSLPQSRTGLLGADLELVDGLYRVTNILDGGDWTPGVDGPLALVGLGIEDGDYLLEIDGRPLAAPTNPFELLEGTAGRTINITVNAEPVLEGARTVAIRPVSSERALRTWDWVNANHRRVDQMSDGRLAYVWLPNTGQGGYTYFNRMYFAQQDRQGAVIDERNNGGGSAADYIVDVLGRELMGYFNSRAGDRTPFTQPMAGLFGPKVMVINELAGSGGDFLPYLFRHRNIGPLVGTRTWGGLVGTWDTPPLIDGGRFVAPRGGFIDLEGNWAVENEGVAPDLEVRNDPKPVIDGGDPQLERAVAEALRLLETERVEFEPEPAPPVRSRRPVPREDR